MVSFGAGLLGAAAIGGISSLVGGAVSRSDARAAAAADRALQREFAQKGIRWRVADAEAAGVHPLYAINANVPTYSPVRRATGQLGRGIAQAGQSVSNYVSRAHMLEARGLETERVGLENEKLRAEIAGQNIANANANRQATPNGEKSLPGQSHSGLWSGPGSPRVYYHVNPAGRLVPSYVEPGDVGHQVLEDQHGNVYSEAVSLGRANLQRSYRRKYGPTGALRWRSRVKVEPLEAARRRRSNYPKRPRYKVPKRYRRSPFRHLQR